MTGRQLFETLYDQYADAIFRYCLFRISNREQAIDMTQEVFTRMWRTYIQDGNEVDEPRALLYTIARNLLVTAYTKQGRTVSLDVVHEATGFEPEDGTEDATRAAHAHELHEKLGKLAAGDAELITLRHLDGLSVQEIAAMLDISENVASVRLHRALDRLRAQYDDTPKNHD